MGIVCGGVAHDGGVVFLRQKKFVVFLLLKKCCAGLPSIPRDTCSNVWRYYTIKKVWWNFFYGFVVFLLLKKCCPLSPSTPH